MKPIEGRKRVIIEEVQPEVDAGRYPVKRILGDLVTVTAAAFCDGHDHVAGRLLYRCAGERGWRPSPLLPMGNDLWCATFSVDKLGSWTYTIEAWVDHFDTWCDDLSKRLLSISDAEHLRTDATSQDIPLALRTGALLLEQIAKRAKGADTKLFLETLMSLRKMSEQDTVLYENPITDVVRKLAAGYPDLDLVTRYPQEIPLFVDRERAVFSSWYELFPRSASPEPTRSGRLADVQELLPEIAGMGFDVLYLPPIHPIGRSFRKGRNNNTSASEDDLGSPWAIGSREGGHKAIHPELGTLNDFKNLVAAAHQHDMEVALDIAFQCSPDHPWVKEHPDWFLKRPDGTIQYAENPPKKYQDIYPLNFESGDWPHLWEELRDVFTYWINQGVCIFRVDNPHTKALSFWEWCITEVHKRHPEVIFLGEAFTRPHVMYSLAKAGFTQSYTYFTWRNSKAELQEYFEDITQPPISDFFRPNLWPNTPDILHATLQTGGRAAFVQRLILASTLGANYGIYGPAFELIENVAVKPGSEEYLNSEKFEARKWDRSASYSLAPLITRINHIRRTNRALHRNESLHFHSVDNPQILCYSKSKDDNLILVAINLDPNKEQAGWVDLDLKNLGIEHDQTFEVEDLLTGSRYQWHDRSNYVALRPYTMPAHIFRVTRGSPVEKTVALKAQRLDVLSESRDKA